MLYPSKVQKILVFPPLLRLESSILLTVYSGKLLQNGGWRKEIDNGRNWTETNRYDAGDLRYQVNQVEGLQLHHHQTEDLTNKMDQKTAMPSWHPLVFGRAITFCTHMYLGVQPFLSLEKQLPNPPPSKVTLAIFFNVGPVRARAGRAERAGDNVPGGANSLETQGQNQAVFPLWGQ